jgi:hypothetical protein
MNRNPDLSSSSSLRSRDSRSARRAGAELSERRAEERGKLGLSSLNGELRKEESSRLSFLNGELSSRRAPGYISVTNITSQLSTLDSRTSRLSSPFSPKPVSIDSDLRRRLLRILTNLNRELERRGRGKETEEEHDSATLAEKRINGLK